MIVRWADKGGHPQQWEGERLSCLQVSLVTWAQWRPWKDSLLGPASSSASKGPGRDLFSPLNLSHLRSQPLWLGRGSALRVG